VSKKYKEIQII